MIKLQGTVLEIFANKMVTTNLGHPVLLVREHSFEGFLNVFALTF